ncbi:MAG TPA: response regulator transcription factor [Marmoricola sp.]|nr:response regulator transcription factor [Marmoricola sp.]
MARILVADDDLKLAALVRTYLERAGHAITVVHDGRAALTECRRRLPDLAVLDIMMPVLDGHDVCHLLRAEGEVPIIFLTARSTEDDLVAGLALGADDYVTKPFSPRELVARVEAVLRRTRSDAEPELLRAGSVVIDEARHTVSREGCRSTAPRPSSGSCASWWPGPGRSTPGRGCSRSRSVSTTTPWSARWTRT